MELLQGEIVQLKERKASDNLSDRKISINASDQEVPIQKSQSVLLNTEQDG